MCEYYEYSKCGLIEKIYTLNGYYIILKGTTVNNWTSGYKDTNERMFYRQFVESGFLTRDLAFESLSAATSFIYGKPCDIKTTITTHGVSDFSDINRLKEAIEFRLSSCSLIKGTNTSKSRKTKSSTNPDRVKDSLVRKNELLESDSLEEKVGVVSNDVLEEKEFNLSKDNESSLYNKEIREEKDMNLNERKDITGHFSGLSPEEEFSLATMLELNAKAKFFSSVLNKKDDSISFLEPYANRIEIFNRDSTEYNESLNLLSRVLNQNDLVNICDTLKYSGVYLAGEAGIGKGMIANNIGALLVEQNDKYNSYAKVFVNCHEAINIAQVSWGTGMNNVEYLGAFYTAFKYAEEHRDCAVVLVLDEINRCKWEELLGAVFELTSSKIGSSHCRMINGVELTYSSNVYIIATGNVGVSFKTGKIDDSGFNDRFQYIKLSGLFDSIEYINSYSKNAALELKPSLLEEKDIYKVLEGVYHAIEFDKRVCRAVSLRKMNNLVCSCKSVEEFDDGVKHLFNENTRKDLGWS